MDERDITIVLKALAEKIRMLEWENEQLRDRNADLVEQCEDMAKKYFEKA